MSDRSKRWPLKLWLARHGESAGNVARDLAHAHALDWIDIADRDVDVPLSARGREQSAALARYFKGLEAAQRPQTILSSPYLRARHTALDCVEACGLASEALLVDERLREREFGILDRLTAIGIRNVHPQQADQRARLGKFYYRAPGGESWCDVILRLRSALDTLSLHLAGRRVLIVAHEVVVLCLRYILEELDEAAILAIDKMGDVANCSLTEYIWDAQSDRLVLARYNDVAHLRRSDAPVTTKPDAPVAPR